MTYDLWPPKLYLISDHLIHFQKSQPFGLNLTILSNILVLKFCSSYSTHLRIHEKNQTAMPTFAFPSIAHFLYMVYVIFLRNHFTNILFKMLVSCYCAVKYLNLLWRWRSVFLISPSIHAHTSLNMTLSIFDICVKWKYMTILNDNTCTEWKYLNCMTWTE